MGLFSLIFEGDRLRQAGMAFTISLLLAVSVPVQFNAHELKGGQLLEMPDGQLTRSAINESAPSQLPAFPWPSPSAVLACLKAHRYTSLICAQAAAYKGAATVPADPTPFCGSSSYRAVCHFGRGRCMYSAVRGWFCACDGGLAAGKYPDCLQAEGSGTATGEPAPAVDLAI